MNSSLRTFEALEKEIVDCRRCPRLVAWRERVSAEKVRRFNDHQYWGRPITAFGSKDASLVVIGLAPAAHGANRTGRIFTGDRSGDWLCEALYRFGFANQPNSVHKNDGLRLQDCIVTAALRCAPPQNKPQREELQKCRFFLCRELQLLACKRTVITLGQIALREFLEAWRENKWHVPEEPRIQFQHGSEWELPGGIRLLVSYHPSQQNTQTGKLTRGMFHSVFERARQHKGIDSKNIKCTTG